MAFALSNLDKRYKNLTMQSKSVEPILEIKDLMCERDERVLFRGVNFSFYPGEVVQIAGPNGAGKTTLLKILTGLSNLFEGEIHWRGKKRDAYDFYSSLLYLGHHPGVKVSLTAMENLAWYFGINGAKQDGVEQVVQPDPAELTKSLEKVGLSGYEDVLCAQMSAGQQRRVGLARLYCSKAPLWILDEPFTAIDKKGVANLETKISEHAQAGGLTLLTTHQPLNIDNVRVVDLGEFREKGA